MTNYASQFELFGESVANGDFSSGGSWTGLGSGVTIAGGQLVSDGTGRSIVEQDITGHEEGDFWLLIVEVAGGGGILNFGTGSMNLSLGSHGIICQTMTQTNALFFDFEEVAAVIESVTLQRISFSA